MEPTHHTAPDPQDAARTLADFLRACPSAMAGHFDELRGMVSDGALDLTQTGLAASSQDFFSYLGAEGIAELPQRLASLQRQLRDNGVSYNVYADPANPARPWALDLFPLLVSPTSWAQIEQGVMQRVRVLEHMMADIYGPQTLMQRGLLPPALVLGHPGYLRAMHGVVPQGRTHLHVAAFDLARGPDGCWWLVGQRTQAPSGLGYLLENRLAISRQFPQAFAGMQVQRLAGVYRAFIDGVQRMCPKGAPGASGEAHIALLTPGPYNETYFEHAYLARYLGVTLVQGSDLLVRNERLYLKTLAGLEPVHGLLKRLDDDYLDPLELRPDSQLGVPGLLQAIRAGNVLVANAPGSAVLESLALEGFLPAIAQAVLGEELVLPALPTWWCGERASVQDVLPELARHVVKPTYPGSQVHANFNAVVGRSLTERERDEWAGRIMRQGEEHTVQGYVPLSQMPVFTGQGTGLDMRSVMLRVYAVCDGPGSWRVLPGGLARLVNADAGVASMQRGGSSADVWVQVGERHEIEEPPSLSAPQTLPQAAPSGRRVTSRAGENLFWLGRYTERAESQVRLARVCLQALNGEEPASAELAEWLGGLARRHGLVLSEVPAPHQSKRLFERALVASLNDASVGLSFNLRQIRRCAAAVRERLSPEQWHVVVRAQEEFEQRCASPAGHPLPAAEAQAALERLSEHLAAITGAQTDRMTRDDGWRLLSIGRHVERLHFLADALRRGVLSRSIGDAGGFEAMLALFDSTITFHASYQQSRHAGALVELLVLNRDNPRSLAWVAHTLRGRLAKLQGLASTDQGEWALRIPDPQTHNWATLSQSANLGQGALPDLLQACISAALDTSERVASTYFAHSLLDQLQMDVLV